MKLKLFILMMFAFLAAFSCKNANIFQSNKADYVFKNAHVYTENAKQPWAEAVAVKGNKIIYVGQNNGIEKFINAKTNVIDLKGKMVMPGFVDGHNHFVMGAIGKRGINLWGAKNKSEMLVRIKDYVKKYPEEKYYMGYNWNFITFGDNPGTRYDLDAICSDKPMLIFNDDNHSSWYNTKAIELAGITKDTPDPVPGLSYYIREADGTPKGISVELEAWMDIAAKIFLNGSDLLEKGMEETFPKLPSWGITAYHDMAISAPSVDDAYKGFDLLEKWEKEGKLTCRVVGVYTARNAKESPEKAIATLKEWNKKYKSELIQVTGLKIVGEGTYSGHTAVLLNDYSDRPGFKGDSAWTTEVFAKWTELANQAGFDVHYHVEGDGFCRRILDAIEIVEKKQPGLKMRNTLHHSCLISPDDLQRIKSLGVLANTTAVWMVDYKGQEDEAKNLLGQKRVDEEYMKQKKLMEMGVNVSFGSDIPGTDPDEIAPLYQIQAAVTGIVPDYVEPVMPPKDRLPSLEQMLHAYTMGGAYQMRMENKIGSIEKGKFADLIILEKNLFDIPQNQIYKDNIMFTMMNGRILLQNKNL